MTSGPLPSSGPERELLVLSLREFSARCEAPSLTPQCPFYEFGSGGPVCGEQCHDLLVNIGGSQPRHVLDLGNGLGLARVPRPVRRGPEADARLFDAAEIYLVDKNRTTDVRHTVSLLTELNYQVTLSPHLSEDQDDRAYLIRASITELVKRGFDRDVLLDIASSATTAAMVTTMVLYLLETSVGEQSELAPPEGSGWEALRLNVLPDPKGMTPFEIIDRFYSPEYLGKIELWNRSRTLEQLTAWKSPTLEEWNAIPMPAKMGKPFTQHKHSSWIFNRFTTTYLSDWIDESLHAEWDYLHSREGGCVPRAEMALRRVDVNELAKEIARRFVEEKDSAVETDTSRLDPIEFQKVALKHLAAERFEAAAAIYEGLNILRPDDLDVLNNLGFCLIPTDRQRAIECLTRVIDEEPSPLMHTYANLVLCYVLENDTVKARDIARAANSCAPEDTAYLWVYDHGEIPLQCASVGDVAGYIERLVAQR